MPKQQRQVRQDPPRIKASSGSSTQQRPQPQMPAPESRNNTECCKQWNHAAEGRARLVHRAERRQVRQARVGGQQARQQRQAHALGGGVYKQDARAQPLPLAERCLPVRGRHALHKDFLLGAQS